MLRQRISGRSTSSSTPPTATASTCYYVFRKVGSSAGAAPLFDERHNPLWAFGSQATARRLLIEFWQRIDPATGALAHDFTDPALDTRFLGDLYQDLSEAARKKYALLQTPEFVEEFILDRTLTPAIEEFGLAEVRLIDPTCGSGHFLLGAFHRLLRRLAEARAGGERARAGAAGARRSVRRRPQPVRRRDRALPAAGRGAEGVRMFTGWPMRRRSTSIWRRATRCCTARDLGGERVRCICDADADPLGHVYATEDAEELRRILGAPLPRRRRQPAVHHVKDTALNEAYRERFGSCHMKYSLAVPFMERFFDLAIDADERRHEPAGYVGMITANSFMKREFGKKLIEEFIPAMGPDARHRHVGRLHPRARHADGDSVRPQSYSRSATDRARCWASGASQPHRTIRRGVWCGRRSSTRSTQAGSESEFVSVGGHRRAKRSTRTRGASAAAVRRS